MEKDKNKEPKKPGDQFAYKPSDDIYSKSKEEEDIDPEDITTNKTPNEEPGKRNEKSFKEDVSGDDLDIPGAELDDDMEDIGSEDEENNDYSLGGDDHDDLEEDRSE